MIVRHLLKMGRRTPAEQYVRSGRVPWSHGYLPYRDREIERALADETLLAGVRAGRLPAGWGRGLDERVVEYPWLFAHLPRAGRLLDAGSTFNFAPLLIHPLLAGRELTIFTLEPERENHQARRISYVYGDLREVPFRDGWFEVVVCQSTLEHIGMDNALYGSKGEAAEGDHLHAARELGRVLRPGGTLFLTVPCGRYEHHGFFQQFDAAMLAQLSALLAEQGALSTAYFRYRPEGWTVATAAECADATSHNPHSGAGRGEDGAAHCRAVCCLRLHKR